MSDDYFDAEFVVNTEALLKEIASNPQVAILEKPINIFGRLLHSVATRAAELNDPELNAAMCRLALYSVADPNKADYDTAILRQVYEAEAEAKKSKLKQGGPS